MRYKEVTRNLVVDVQTIMKQLAFDHRLDPDEYEYLLQSASIAALCQSFDESHLVYFKGVDIWSQQYYSLFSEESDWLCEIREDLMGEFGFALKSHIDYLKYHFMPYSNNIYFHEIKLVGYKLFFNFTLF